MRSTPSYPLALITVISFFFSQLSVAEPLSPPTLPDTPPALGGTLPSRVLTCPRLFLYRHKMVACDSYHLKDAENFRPIFAPVPEAVDLLDRYQSNRRSIAPMAYVGSAGLVMLLLGTVFGSLISSAGTRQLLRYAGATVTVGTVTYGIIRLKGNENKITDAVEIYNQARPEDPIQIQFDATFKLY